MNRKYFCPSDSLTRCAAKCCWKLSASLWVSEEERSLGLPLRPIGGGQTKGTHSPLGDYKWIISLPSSLHVVNLTEKMHTKKIFRNISAYMAEDHCLCNSQAPVQVAERNELVLLPPTKNVELFDGFQRLFHTFESDDIRL